MTSADDVPSPETVRSVTAPATAWIDPVKGSRFRGSLAPVADEAAAIAFVDAVRAEDPDATHHCWAFALVDGLHRSSDDGEPRDTAGAPILRHLLGHEVADVVVVVTRWYGGTNLGRGGLVRAYGDAAAAVLGAATIETRPVLSRFTLAHPYDLTGAVDGVLAAHDATELASSYGVRVERVVAVPRALASSFAAAVVEATGGRVRPASGG